MLPTSLAAAAVLTAALVGVFSISLAACALRSNAKGTASRLTTVPALAKCVVSGLLAGLGLVVMLPSALEHRPADMSLQSALLVFCSAPLVMFFVHHVVLNHVHDHGGAAEAEGGDSFHMDCECGVPAVKRSMLVGWGDKMTFCPPVGKGIPQVPMPPAPQRAKPKAGQPLEKCTAAASVLLRALPYTVHAAIDGALLGTARSATTLASLAVPITLCAMQDVGTIMMSLAAANASYRAKMVTTALFGIGFPFGASLALALTAASTASASDHASAERALCNLRAFAAGLFLYMAIFELAPSHAHGRLVNLRYLLAFTVGFALAFSSEAAESWFVEHATAKAAPVGRAGAWAAVEIVKRSAGGMPAVAAVLLPGNPAQ